MKIKTCVTGLNRKQVRSLALELAAKLECASLENMLLCKRYKDLEKRHMALAKLNEEAEKELHEAKVNLAGAIDKNVELAEDFFKQSQERNKVDDQLKLSMLTVEARDKEIVRLRGMLNDLMEEKISSKQIMKSHYGRRYSMLKLKQIYIPGKVNQKQLDADLEKIKYPKTCKRYEGTYELICQISMEHKATSYSNARLFWLGMKLDELGYEVKWEEC